MPGLTLRTTGAARAGGFRRRGSACREERATAVEASKRAAGGTDVMAARTFSGGGCGDAKAPRVGSRGSSFRRLGDSVLSCLFLSQASRRIKQVPTERRELHARYGHTRTTGARPQAHRDAGQSRTDGSAVRRHSLDRWAQVALLLTPTASSTHNHSAFGRMRGRPATSRQSLCAAPPRWGAVLRAGLR